MVSFIIRIGTRLFISRMVSTMDNDDGVSVTSTAASEQREEYLVDRIVGERENEGVKEYFVMWEGYPDHRCTWEPETNFNDGVIIPTWEHTKMRVKRRLEEPFDVAALEQKIRDWEEATALRKLLRREKRKRLGLPVAESEEEEEEAQDEDNPFSESDQQSQTLTERTLDTPRSHQRGKKKSVSDTSESSSDESDNVPLTSRTDSIESQTVSSDDDRPLVRKKGTAKLIKKRPYQGTQRPSKIAPEIPKATHSMDETTLTKGLNVSDGLSQKGNREPRDETAQAGKAGKPPSAPPKPHAVLNLRRASIETPVKKPSNPQPLRPKPPNPVEVEPTPKKRGRPVGWRKYSGTLDQDDKELQQPKVGVKTAPSSARRKVTGSVISKNWNKPIPKKRISFVTASSTAENPGVGNAKNQNRFRNLATQHRFAKASRNEPPPRMEDLILYNAKEGPPKPGAKNLTPFQMIQAKINAESSMPVGSMGEHEPSFSFGDSEKSPKYVNAMPLKIQRSPVSPLAIETKKSVTFAELEDKGDSPITSITGTRKTVMFAEPEDMPTSPVKVAAGTRRTVTFVEPGHNSKSPAEPGEILLTSPQNDAFMEGPLEEDGDKADRDAMDISSDYSPPEAMTIDTTGKGVSDAQQLINSWGFQNPPSARPDPLIRSANNDSRLSRSRQDHKSTDDDFGHPLIGEEPILLGETEREQKLWDKPSSNHTSAQVMRAGDSDPSMIGPRWSSRGFNGRGDPDETSVILPWNQVQGNATQHTRNCTVFGALFKGENFVVSVAYVGLPFVVRTLFLSIKVPPKDVNVHLRHVCTVEDYKRYFHTVSSATML